MATIDVKDAAGATVPIEKPLAPGRAAAVASRPVAISTEDKAALDLLATQATLAAVLAKIIAAPATEAKQDTLITAIAAVLTQTALAASAAIIGKVGIDQTTPGVTNAVDNNTARRGTLTSRSGAMTAGATSQQLMAANANRKYLLIQNPATAAGQGIATAERLVFRFGADAAGIDDGTSYELLPGGSKVFEGAFVSTEAVQVNATTIAHRWIAAEG